ncbi:MAG TPA: hypothetical protein VFG91_01305 [Woeseiaceae bacterium]|nr:hypothetical protein [Woeseiaceae bacterium]
MERGREPLRDAGESGLREAQAKLLASISPIAGPAERIPLPGKPLAFGRVGTERWLDTWLLNVS